MTGDGVRCMNAIAAQKFAADSLQFLDSFNV